MPEPEGGERDAFLQRIADGLPFDEAEKLDILHELAAHLADSTARLEADGLSRTDAERTALDRLGSPERLAVELTHARRTPRRLLAAAGARPGRPSRSTGCRWAMRRTRWSTTPSPTRRPVTCS